MKILVAAVIILSMVFMAVCQIVKNRRMKAASEKRMKLSTFILFSVALIMSVDVCASEDGLSPAVMALDLMPSVLAMWLLSSSLSEYGFVKWTVFVMLLCNLSLLVFHVCRKAGVAGAVSDSAALSLISVLSVVQTVIFVSGWAACLGNVKSIMQKGNVWSVVCLCVDLSYFCFVLAGVALVCMKCMLGVLLLCGVVNAIGFRLLSDSAFVLWKNQERIIVESMKIASVSTTDSSQIEDVYKDLYTRIVAYFDFRKPYLDNDLTIQDVARDLYSNKLYVSRAISQFTGRNFCQFVNYYRVVHSMELFRGNPELRVHSLALMSGFNSIVSFNMAFRLFMGENPSEWCRKERGRLLKK